MAKSTPSQAARKATKKPAKPYPEFPLYAHASGRWAKKIKGRIHYFGKWAHRDAALQRYLDEIDDLQAGRTPRSKRDGLTVQELCNRFLSAKEAKVDSGELATTTWKSYLLSCKRLVKHFGKSRLVEDLCGDDFDVLRAEFAKTNGLVGLRNQINHTRIVFRYAYEAGLLDRPVRFGANFKRPSAKAIRKQRTPRMFEAEEIRRMLADSGPIMNAMILLGVNCGFGNTDVELLTEDALDLEGGWVQFPRPKTGADRRIPLWPNTIVAVQNSLKVRPKPAAKDLQSRVFLTKRGGSYHKVSTRYLSEQFSVFLKQIGLHRRGVGFYTLRHVFETIGGESRDQVAVDAIMGHERGDMASIYRERISDERLQNVVDTVRNWLFPEPNEPLDHIDEVPEAPHVIRFPSTS